MAKTITELTAAGTLTGVELMPVVQSGTTVKATLNAIPVAATQLTGTIATARLGSGSASSTTYLRGDQTWVASPAVSGSTTTAYIGMLYGNGTNVEADSSITTDGSGNLTVGSSITATNGSGIINGNDFLTELSYRFDQELSSGDVGNACIYLNGDGMLHWKDVSSADHTVMMTDTVITTPSVSVVNISSSTILTANSTHFVNTSVARTLTFPSPTVGCVIVIKDSTFQSQTNPITVARHASENIEGTSSNMTLQGNGGFWTFTSDGTNWFLTA